VRGMGTTLKSKLGPLPVWAWTLMFIVLLIWWLRRRKAQQASAQATAQQQGLSTDLGTTNVSNLTTQAQPMPIQMGDTFVDVQPQNVTVNPTINNIPPAPSSEPPPALPPPNPPAPAPIPVPGPAPTPYVQPIRARPGCSAMPWGGLGACVPVTPAGTLPHVAPPAPSPVRPPAPAPAAPRTVTVCAWPSWCGSLSGIAQHFYGNASEWTKIYSANKGKIGSNPNLIHPGQVLVVP
jgi:hypothetical protein